MPLAVKYFWNSPVEAVLNFKTCCGGRTFDLNLELHVTNQGESPVAVPSHFDLIVGSGLARVDTLIPPGIQVIDPGVTIAFYCAMDEAQWAAARRLVMYDLEGGAHSAPITHDTTDQGA
jgi:hypothetical protein